MSKIVVAIVSAAIGAAVTYALCNADKCPCCCDCDCEGCEE